MPVRGEHYGLLYEIWGQECTRLLLLATVIMASQFFPSLITIFLLDFLQKDFAWKLTVLALFVTDIKTFPLVWHIRLLNALRFVLPCQRAEPGPTPNCIFKPLVTSSHCSLSEIDFNWHKSNSTYYSDLDIARTHLLCTLFSVGIDRARHKHGNGIINLRKDSFTIKLGAVKCSFRREIRPYERYEMWTRVLSWETKWLYTITHFVRKDPKSKGTTVCATAISQCVFKSGRRTIPPEVMLRTSGLWPHEIFPRPILPVAAAHHHTLNEVTGQAGIEDSHKHQYALDTLRQSDSVDGDGWIGSQKVTNMQTGGCTSEMIENERRRGMGTVNGGDLDDLEQDFFADVDLLGRHFDL